VPWVPWDTGIAPLSRLTYKESRAHIPSNETIRTTNRR
jgi:hypothetical protein